MANKEINFELKREGFPVKVGPIEFFIGTSIEDLKNFFGIQEEIEKKVSEISKKIERIKDLENGSQQDMEEAIELTKELTRIRYDAALGDGAFNKIYEVFPYTDVLAEKLDDIVLAIADRVGEETSKRADKYNKKKADMLKKKQLKKKK